VGEEAGGEAGGCGEDGEDGDLVCWRDRRRDGGRGRVEGVDDGAEVVDVCFHGAGNEEEAEGQEPHGWVGEEAPGFAVQEPGFAALFFDHPGGARGGQAANAHSAITFGGEFGVV
ncbi:MAG: hypothetical protein LQ340_004070, partial [Diploschistes diacapsis]